MNLFSTVSPSSLLNPIGQPGTSAQQAGSTPLGGSVAGTAGSFSQGLGIRSAALLALSQVGATSGAPASTAPSVASGGSTAAQPASEAVQSFLQSLYAALQVQAATSDTAAGGANASSISAALSHGHHHGHGAHAVRADLANVAEQLSSSAAPASGGAVSALQQSFNNLLSTSGASSTSQATLANFLHTFASDLSARPAGTILSAHA